MTSINFLDQVQIFQGLSREQLAGIVKICEQAEFLSGTRIFEQGEQALYLWIVKEGRVDLVVHEWGFESSCILASRYGGKISLPHLGSYQVR